MILDEDSANGLRSLNETLIDDCGRCRLDWNRELFHRRLNRDTTGNLSTPGFVFPKREEKVVLVR